MLNSLKIATANGMLMNLIFLLLPLTSQIKQAGGGLSEIDLDLVAAQRSMEELKLSGDKPLLSDKALGRITRRNKQTSPSPPGCDLRMSMPVSSLVTDMSMASEMSMSLEQIQGTCIRA